MSFFIKITILFSIGDVLETAMQLAIQTNDGPALERNYNQLRQYYSDHQSETPVQKTARQHSLGLYLMYLLIETNLSAFHTLVERLSEEDRTSTYIYFPLKLEMLLQEGSYNKILASRNSDTIPSPFYKPFFDRLTSTIRDDIAECASSAYTTLSVPAAIKMMMFDNVTVLNNYITEKNLPWIIDNNTTIRLKTIEKTKPEIDALQLMKNTTQYASELEKIV